MIWIVQCVIVTGIVERLDMYMCKGKDALDVHISCKSLTITDRQKRKVMMTKAETLVCRIYNMPLSPDKVRPLMPGHLISFEGLLCSVRNEPLVIITSTIV